jgi:hypothetical protein
MDVLKDLFSMLVAVGLVFPHLGIILIGSGSVLVCIGTIFWRLAQREQTPLLELTR